MGEFSIGHWLVVLVVVMIFWGPKKLPEIARSLGESIREFKKSFQEGVQMEGPEKKQISQKTEIKENA